MTYDKAIEYVKKYSGLIRRKHWNGVKTIWVNDHGKAFRPSKFDLQATDWEVV